MTGGRWFPTLFFAAALAAAVWRAPRPAPPAFVAPAPATADHLPSAFSSEPLPVAGASAHAATLAELPDGRLVAAWFAGSREGAADVAVWLSLRDASGWTAPRMIADRAGIGADTAMAVRKLGNPVLAAQGGKLHLWAVSASIGGWAGSSLNHRASTDGGATWSPAEKLVTSPFLNISTLVRTPPVSLADGGLGLPVYHEFIAKHGEWLRLGADGEIVDKVRLPVDRPAIQPAVVALDGMHALALLRDAGGGDGRVQTSTTADAGAHWTAGDALPIRNPNASIALLRLRSGKLLLAANPDAGRNVLRLFVSTDDGQTWQASRTVAESSDGGAEYSYPALLQGKDGRIHLAFTWLRQGIRHASFTEAWLMEADR